MSYRDDVRDAIGHRQPASVPYTLPMEDSVAARLDAHFGNRDWRKRLAPYIVQVSAVDTDMSTPVGTTHRRDGYGGMWRIDSRPWHLETPPLARPSFEGYEFPKPEQFFRPAWKAAAVRTCAENQNSFVVASLGWGLFERSWNLRGFENILMDFVAEEGFVEEALDRLTDLYLSFVAYTVDVPVDAILFGDDWGDQRGIIIGPERWRRFLKPRWARIYRAVHDAGKIVMHHSCGSVAEILPDAVEIGMDVLESCQPEAAGMAPHRLKRQWGDRIAFWGCLGSQSTIPCGTPDGIRDEVRRLRRQMGRGGGFILAPAKPLQPETPTENAVAVLEAFTEM
jgi:uroporphyrinogen decarboxylase